MSETHRCPSLVATLFLLGLTSIGLAQEYMFTTLAGAGGPGSTDGPASRARFNSPQGIAVDTNGTIYLSDSFNATIRKVGSDGTVTTLAGLAENPGYNNGLGAEARFFGPAGLALAPNGNLYLADEYSHTIRQISPLGAVTTFAGSPASAGADDGLGNAARFTFPSGLAIAPSGTIFVADSLNHAIRQITPAGEVTTYAGSAEGSGSDDGLGTAARFNFPRAVALAADGSLYVADTENHTIRKIAPDRVVTTFAGTTGQPGSADGLATAAQFRSPTGIATDAAGNIYVADNLNSTIRRITPAGTVTTLAGDPTQPDLAARPFVSYTDGPGNLARFKYPAALTLDNTGQIYVADSGNNSIRRITPNNVVSTVAGSSPQGTNDGSQAVARFDHPTGVVVAPSGTLFVVDGVNNTVRQITTNGTVTTIAGQPGQIGSADGLGDIARFNGPRKLARGSNGDIFVADTANSTLRRLTLSTASGTDRWAVSTLAGLAGSTGSDDGRGNAARFNALYDVAVDSQDNLYVADKDNQVIRKVTPAGDVTTFAGTPGVAGYADGPGESAQFKVPYGIAVDRVGVIYVADTLNHLIRKITPDRVVTTLAGEVDSPGSEDGLGNLARFNAPYGVAVDDAGNVYVADYLNNLIRKISPEGLVTTLAGQVRLDPEGNPLPGSADGAGPLARFFNPKGIAVDPSGTIYLPDSFNNSIRVGTTNSCPDLATIDASSAPAGVQRQLDTLPQSAVSWEWSLIRRPANSSAVLSATNIRNPTFTPDIPDIFVFQLRATNAAGATCVRTVTLNATAPPPSIDAPSVIVENGELGFTFQGVPGKAVRIQLSPDLVNWITIGTLTNTTGTAGFVDPFQVSKRFYRLQQL